MKLFISLSLVGLLAVNPIFAQRDERFAGCRIIDGVAYYLVTPDEAKRGDVSLRCVRTNGGIVYSTIPANEYAWRGCRKKSFRLPVHFFAISENAKFVTKDCSIRQMKKGS